MGNHFHRWASNCLSVPSQVFREQLIVFPRHLIRLLRLLVVNLSFVESLPILELPLLFLWWALVCNKEELFCFWWSILWPDWWRRNGLSTWSCFGEHFHVRFWRELGDEEHQSAYYLVPVCGRYLYSFQEQKWCFEFFTLPKWETTTLNSHRIELEQNDEIPFRDILLKRNLDSSFSTSIYRKKTFTGLYTKWDSLTPRKYKTNLVCTLAYRCIRICSSPRLL